MHANMIITMVKVIIRILHVSFIKQHLSFISSFVSKERKEKADKFVNEKDQLLSLGAGYLMKRYLPKEDIAILKSGKPYLPHGPFFNVSHSGEYVIFVAHQSRDVGVDIERIDENRLDGIHYVLGQEEKKINDINTLFQIWSNKESLIKCLSTGLKDIKSVKGLPLDGVRMINEQEYFTRSLIYNGYSLSVTLKGKEPFIIEIVTVSSLEEQ